MPQTEAADQLDQDRRKLRQIVDSVKARNAEDRWKAEAWRRVFVRLAAHARRERAELGQLHRGTERLVRDARTELGHASTVDLRPEESLAVEAQWLLLEVDQGLWSDMVQRASPLFHRAVRAGDMEQAESVLRATRLRLARNDDDWNDDDWTEDDDPLSPPARPPISVIPPRRACEPTSAHPYADTRQYRQASRAHDVEDEDQRREVMNQARAVFGEGLGVMIGPKPRPYVPAHRPHRGTKSPEAAEGRLLAQCPGRTIEELRKVAGARGKPSAQLREIRTGLEDAIYRIRDAKGATNEALLPADQRAAEGVAALRAHLLACEFERAA